MMKLWGTRTTHWKLHASCPTRSLRTKPKWSKFFLLFICTSKRKTPFLVKKERKPSTVQKCLFHVLSGKGLTQGLGPNFLLFLKKDHKVRSKNYISHVLQGRSSDSMAPGQNGHSMFMHIMCKLFTSANTEYKLTSLYSSKKFNNSIKERRKNTSKRIEVLSTIKYFKRTEG